MEWLSGRPPRPPHWHGPGNAFPGGPPGGGMVVLFGLWELRLERVHLRLGGALYVAQPRHAHGQEGSDVAADANDDDHARLHASALLPPSLFSRQRGRLGVIYLIALVALLAGRVHTGLLADGVLATGRGCLRCVVGVDFVFAAGTMFLADSVATGEMSVAGGVFQTMVQMYGVILNIQFSLALHLSQQRLHPVKNHRSILGPNQRVWQGAVDTQPRDTLRAGRLHHRFAHLFDLSGLVRPTKHNYLGERAPVSAAEAAAARVGHGTLSARVKWIAAAQPIAAQLM
ncbi:hypothetical protein B0H14DRAFT_3635953 [Mycena olivaceomarginata]|nr:hypothetical protein B0H14DRAFT_3635953 [Mycena olivaceomarginata]